MPIFSDAFRTQLEHPSATPRWTDALLSNGGEARMELALRMMAPPVSHGILTLMGSEETDEVNQGIGLFWAVCLAGADGWHAEGLVDHSHVRVSKGDQEILVCPMTSQRFRTPDVQNQRYQKLGAQLERLMPKYKFVAHFKSSIPDNFDGAVLVEPVTNWIQEIERGFGPVGMRFTKIRMCLLNCVFWKSPNPRTRMDYCSMSHRCAPNGCCVTPSPK